MIQSVDRFYQYIQYQDTARIILLLIFYFFFIFNILLPDYRLNVEFYRFLCDFVYIVYIKLLVTTITNLYGLTMKLYTSDVAHNSHLGSYSFLHY